LAKLTHEQRDKLRFICHICGYDMTGRADADPCPECNTPFDTRLDLPDADNRSKRAVVYMVIAILCNPLAVPIGFILLFIAYRTTCWLEPKETDFRIPYHITKRRKLIELLGWVWCVELFALVAISWIWPQALNWW